jgi:hypothetical protein
MRVAPGAAAGTASRVRAGGVATTTSVRRSGTIHARTAGPSSAGGGSAAATIDVGIAAATASRTA